MKKSKFIFVGSVLGLLLAGGTAQASWWTDYYESVPSFNGLASTPYEALVYESPEEISVISENVGADYTVDVRFQRDSDYQDYTSGWVQRVGDNESWVFRTNSWLDAGDKHRLQLSNDLYTPVDVEAYGDWKNDTIY